MKNDVLSIMTCSPVIPVIVIDDLEQAVPLAQALYRGGLRVLEVTLRTEQGLTAIAEMQAAIPQAFIGAGTVTRPEEIEAVINAGGKFLVSPGATDSLIEAVLEHDIPWLPGIATPSEAMRLLERGFSHMKFFPAEAAGGIPMLKSIYGPLAGITFCPTGGITVESASDYLKLPNVACVGGSWMVPQKLVQAGDWEAIEGLAREAAALAR